jgi:hypothetical protein
MKLAIMQPYFVPYIGYFQLINLVDRFVIYDDVNYIKGGWINRNRILINSEPRYLTVPLKGMSPNKLINEIFLTSEEKSMDKLMKTIYMAYKSAPFFDEVFSLLKECLMCRGNISGFNTQIIKKICFYLGIKTQIIETSTRYNNKDLKGQNRVLDICRQENATHYINPIGGQSLYDANTFKENGIQLNFINTAYFEYKQFNNDHVPFLSIVDIMMFNSPDEITQMLDKYTLV